MHVQAELWILSLAGLQQIPQVSHLPITVLKDQLTAKCIDLQCLLQLIFVSVQGGRHFQHHMGRKTIWLIYEFKTNQPVFFLSVVHQFKYINCLLD